MHGTAHLCDQNVQSTLVRLGHTAQGSEGRLIKACFIFRNALCSGCDAALPHVGRALRGQVLGLLAAASRQVGQEGSTGSIGRGT